ncbi:MAG: Mrp/NBP35 family ATP-binding protein [Ruminococcaceae bacterium]|nr:Mrp/NBP35 family ATP-binding protein [Oscillospiraceae bacterium]
MSENCTHDCSTCASKGNCSSEIQKEKLNAYSNVKKVYGIVSGKGGVGKSLVTSLMATTMARRDNRVAIIDADITGPSIPKMFGVKSNIESCSEGLIPSKSKMGIEMTSVNLMLENESDPVVWRGPVIAGMVKQFWTDFIWSDIDYMFIDMPPGTGDVPLTVFQSIPLDGIIIVTSPQELVSMIVKKAVKMAKLMNVPIVAIVENMSYIKCPDCNKEIHVFGESHIDEIAKENGIDTIGKIPMDPSLANLSDKGAIELFEGDWLENVADKIEK